MIEALQTALDTEQVHHGGGGSSPIFQGYYHKRLEIAFAQQDLIECARELRKHLRRVSRHRARYGQPLKDADVLAALEYFDGAERRFKFLQDERSYS